MAAMLKSAAVRSVNRGQAANSFHPQSRQEGQRNPVLTALDQEVQAYVGLMLKRASSSNTGLESSARQSDQLFNLWNKYEHKLSKAEFQSKLLEMGDFLISIQEYNLALRQCYERYLKSFGEVNVDEISDVKSFKAVFFPRGFGADDADFTFRALMGRSVCAYQVIRQMDSKLQNSHSVNKSIRILCFLRLLTQVILPQEKLCWLVYNGTRHIYSIVRHLMAKGHSAKVLEFALWAAMCMESSVPLLGVRYLKWRATLYAAVCQCYYDCKAGHHAEAFARRALGKISELSQLESMSCSPQSKDTEEAFRQATIKMALMVFKRTVFETRRKPKGLLRPKTRANLKDAAQLPWPRTQSERLLSEMFEGGSAQLLCLLETLTDSNRRTLLSAPPAAEGEFELLDVYAELFMAVQELIAGGGGNQSNVSAAQRPSLNVQVPGFGGVCNEAPLMEIASRGEDGVPLSCVVRVIKLSYCYEQWELFDSLLAPCLTLLKELNSPQHSADVKALEILQAYDRVVARNKHRKLFPTDDEEDLAEANAGDRGQLSGGSFQDDLIHLAEVLQSVIYGPLSPDQVDIDMMVDATLLLWSKCKAIFQKFQTGSTDNPKYLQRMENASKWVYALDIVLQALGWTGLSTIDPALTAEVVLRLALVFEASASLEASKTAKLGGSRKEEEEEEEATLLSTIRGAHFESASSPRREPGAADNMEEDFPSQSELSQGASRAASSRHSIFSAAVLSQSVHEQLGQARDILELGLGNVSAARTAVALTDGKSIADVIWAKELNQELFQPTSAESYEEVTNLDRDATSMSLSESQADSAGTAVWNTIRDLHMELIFMYHRVCLKLSALSSEAKSKATRRSRVSASAPLQVGSKPPVAPSFDELVARTRCNGLSRALLFMQRAVAASPPTAPSPDQRHLLQESIKTLKQVERDEKRLYTDNLLTLTSDPEPKVMRLPPPPLLLCRTEVNMVLKPAPFTPESGEKVAWYCIFARNASGSNVKVRLNDYSLPGTGEQIPAFRCEFDVRGLTPGERYVFAVAAYTADGQIIGGGIGASTRPVLAAHPMPVLMAWAYLSQISFQVGCWDICEQACAVLWGHFVTEPPPSLCTTHCSSARSRDFKLTLHRLNQRVVRRTSPVLLRLFLTAIFVRTEEAVRQEGLFCDQLNERGPLLSAQLARLQQCERLLVAVRLAGWLNEASLALQAAVQCYGLLAPLLHLRLPAAPVVQVLEWCSAVLQEIPPQLRLKRAPPIADSLHHMTACLTFNMAKVLRTWGQRALAGYLNESGRRLLAQDPSRDPRAEGEGAVTETGSLTLAALKKKKMRRGTGVASSKEDSCSTGNEQLKALEAHMLRLSKQDFPDELKAQGEHELTGNEDPCILHAYVAYLPSRVAYKEVVKFKRRARYLEFLVHCVQKALSEGSPDQALEWCQEAAQWMAKRNETIVGTRGAVGKQPGAVTVVGDDPRKFQAALVEYGKDRSPRTRDKMKNPVGLPAPAQKPRKKPKYKAIGVTNTMSDAQRAIQEDLEIQALDILSLYFIDAVQTNARRKKLRRLSAEEMPWRAQLSVLEGLSQFASFLHKLDARERMFGPSASHTFFRTSFLEADWFTFDNARTLVVNWSGGPSRQPTRLGGRADKSDVGRESEKASAIEMAAAAATGKVLSTTEGGEESPRTYLSELTGASPTRQKGTKAARGKEPPLVIAMEREEGVELLQGALRCLQRGVVLAHRGRHWTLLQNASRSLWNCTQLILTRGHSPDRSGAPFIPASALRALLWQPLHVAADCLLDMLVQLQQQGSGKGKEKEAKAWMGGVSGEQGGASLRFEDPLDDLSLVDMRWLRRLVLRTIELLYYEQKWERLADIALRFNALSNDRYAEAITPLAVQAQRHLVARVAQHGGRPPPQPHYQEAELAGPITAQAYARLQLRVQLKDEELSQIDPGAHIDPEGHDAYSGGLHALRLCCVPLDVDLSLRQLRQALANTPYTARALVHSRRLLSLYLAGQTSAGPAPSPGPGSRSGSRVDFLPNTARPQPPTPPDLSQEEFVSADDVQTAPLPKSQVSIVISSYEKTIELLVAGNQRELAAQAMRELGNLLLHTGNSRGAYKWWAQAVDLILQMPDALRQWRNAAKDDLDLSSVLLNRCGLWGCLLAGVLCSNIAQYILSSDLGLRLECSFLAGFLFKALLRSSLPHPTSDHDYALYEVGEGCEMPSLVPGIDLLSEKFRADGRSLVAALRFILDELHRSRHCLFVLPLLTVYLYFTTSVCRDLQRTVSGRILRVRLLTELGLHSEAAVTLQQLLRGDRLPNASDSASCWLGEGRTPRLDPALPLLDPSNLKALDALLDKRLASHLGPLYGPHLTCHLTLTHAHLLIALADCIPSMPKFEDVAPPGSHPYNPSQSVTSGPPADRRRVPFAPKPPKASVKESECESSNLGSDEDDSNLTRQPRHFAPSSQQRASLDTVKGSLLTAADQMLATVSEIIIENAQNDKGLHEHEIRTCQTQAIHLTSQGLENLDASELELVVDAKLQLSAIARQRHHAPMAARIAFSALRILQKAHLFQHRRSRSEDERSPPASEQETRPPLLQEAQSRVRLDARTWLQCRLALVISMTGELKGMGQVKGPERPVKAELADVRQYISDGQREAEAAGDVEMQAEFLAQAALLSVLDGRSTLETQGLLRKVLDRLSDVPQLSARGQLLRADVLGQLTDLQEGEDVLPQICQAQSLLLDQLESLGETIEHHAEPEHSAPLAPLKNLLLAPLQPLVQTKLRIGRALTYAALKSHSRSMEEVWAAALGVLQTALEMSKVISCRAANVEVEILLCMGKVQRQLFHLGRCNARVAGRSLLEAIKTSHANDHNLSLMRQAYLEMAILYIASGGLAVRKDGRSLDSVTCDLVSPKEGVVSQHKILFQRAKTAASDSESQTAEQRAAWLALRCASAVGQAARHRSRLAGDASVNAAGSLNVRAQHELPEFLLLDLLGGYVLGEKKRIYRNEIEEELAPLTEALEPPAAESYEEQLSHAREAASSLSWTHVIGYQSMLQRLSTLPSGTAPWLPWAQPWALRLAHLHRFLAQCLPAYASDCSAIFPPAGLHLDTPPEDQTDCGLKVTFMRYSSNQSVPLDVNPEGAPASPPSAHPFKPSDKHIAEPRENMICFQWYAPPLDDPPAKEEGSDLIMLLYGMFLRPDVRLCGLTWLPCGQLQDLRERLSALVQQGEISLVEKAPKRKREKPPVADKKGGRKAAARIKALSPKAVRDDKLEALMKECLVEVQALFGGCREEEPAATEATPTVASKASVKSGESEDASNIPFDVSKNNLRSLEQLFDLNFGNCMNDPKMLSWFSAMLSA